MEIDSLLLVPIFFTVALFYSIAGFGGGSSYLTILALSGIEFGIIRFIGLICNIVVVTSGSLIFYKYKYLNLKNAIPFVILSIPMAFLGGKWQITENSFFILLGITLLIVAILLWFSQSIQSKKSFLQKKFNIKNHQYSWLIKLLIGGVIGFISGLVGIGGGIFLSPILYLIHWDKAKNIAALSSFFILVNSLSGLTGQLLQNSLFNNLKIHFYLIILLVIAVFIGGQIGSRLSATKINPFLIKKLTAILILIVSLRILNQYL